MTRAAPPCHGRASGGLTLGRLARPAGANVERLSPPPTRWYSRPRMAFVSWFPVLATFLSVGPLPTAAGASPAPTSSYEALAQEAVRTNDVATLLAPFVDHCDGERRDLDRARCRAVLAYLRRTLPQQTFALGTDDPAAITVSDYDAGVRGYHLALAGCIACTKPVVVGRGGEPRFVTVKTPDKGGESLSRAVAISQGTFGFDSLAEAHRWLEKERPFLRAEFLFQPQAADAEWTFGSSHGVAVRLLGARVYNRCTGQVLLSNPPSVGTAERALAGDRDPSCRDVEARVAQVVPPEDLPAQLGKVAIAEAMGKIRASVFACYQKFHVPGRLELTYVVANNGTVQSVVLGSAYAGTETGRCALEVAKDARFSPFQIERQKFTYPFFLRD